MDPGRRLSTAAVTALPTTRRCSSAPGSRKPDGDLFARPGRSAQRPYRLVAALDLEQLDRTADDQPAPIDARAPASTT